MALLELRWSIKFSPAVMCRPKNLEVPEDIEEASLEEYFANMVWAGCFLATGLDALSDACRARHVKAVSS